MKRFDFYNLPRGLQDRFIESTQGVAVPLAIAARPFRSRKALVWGLAGLGFAVALLVVVVRGFGDLESDVALAGPVQLGIYMALTFGALFSGAKAYWVASAEGALPYVTADYLFPSGAIKVVGSTLLSYDAAELEVRRGTGATLSVRARGGPLFQFPFANAEGAEAAAVAFEEGQRRWAHSEGGDPLERARLSCLVESGIPNPLAPTKPHPRPSRGGALASYFGAFGLASLVGLGVGLIRNELSEKAMFEAASRADTVEAYEKYVARGGRRSLVADTLLPRARLAVAVREGSTAEVIAFAQGPDADKIRPEVDAAVRTSLLGELRAAQKAGTLTALAELGQKFPQVSLIAAELAQARHTIYQSAYQAFLEKAVDDKSLTTFVGHLLAYAEKNGPRVVVRFSHEFPQDTEIVDTIVKKSEKYYLGSKSLPSPHFLGERARRREKLLGESVVEALGQLFPRDVLAFELAPLPERENVPLPPVTEPTLTLTHKETLSGGFVGGAPKNMYLGATVRITATFELPGDRPKHEFVFALWRNPSFSIPEARPTDIDQVYEDMMSGAFEEFKKTYLKKWLKS